MTKARIFPQKRRPVPQGSRSLSHRGPPGVSPSQGAADRACPSTRCSPLRASPRGWGGLWQCLCAPTKCFCASPELPPSIPAGTAPGWGGSPRPPAGTGVVPGAAARAKPSERVQAQVLGAEVPVSHGNRSWQQRAEPRHLRGNQRQSDSIQDVRPAGSAAHTPTSHRCPAQKGFIYPVESKFRVCSCLPSAAAAGSSRKLQLNAQICT